MSHNLSSDQYDSSKFHFHYPLVIIKMNHIIFSPMEMAILLVKLNWLSVATITTFIIGVEFKISPGRSVKAMTHSMLNLKFLLESSEQKPTRFIRKHCSSGGYLKCNSWIYRSASTCISGIAFSWNLIDQKLDRKAILTPCLAKTNETVILKYKLVRHKKLRVFW